MPEHETEIVTATWRGPFPGLIGTPAHHVRVEYGDTAEIPINQARASAHWEFDDDLPAADEHLDLDELKKLDRKTLDQIAADRGISVTTGSGKGGTVVKDDIAQAIFDARDTSAAPGGDAGEAGEHESGGE